MKVPLIIRSVIVFLCFFSLSCTIYAQGIPIGQWRVYQSFNSPLIVDESSSNIYCATTGGIFSVNKDDNSINKLSRIDGLSGVEASTMAYNSHNNTLVVAYADASIDILQGGNVTSLTDIKRKTSLGNKIINNIFFINNNAYVSCGFGIVLIDLEKKEIKDTYYIGPNGSTINVRGVSSDGNNLYAATDNGIYVASLSSPNLASFTYWTKMQGIPNGIYNAIAFLGNKVYASYSRNLSFTTNNWMNDTIFIYDGTNWTKHFGPYVIKSLRAKNNKLVIGSIYHIEVYDSGFNQLQSINSYKFADVRLRDAIADEANAIWVADFENGLVKVYAQNNAEKVSPSGPYTTNVNSVSIQNQHLALAPGGMDAAWGNQFQRGLVSFFKQNTWINDRGVKPSLKLNMDTLFDVNCVAIDPENSDHVFAGSWVGGVLEFYNDSLYKTYKETNSSMKQIVGLGNYYSIRIGGLDFDKDGNLWVSQSNVSRILHCRKKDGTWVGYDFPPTILGKTVGPLIATEAGQKWIVLPRGGGLLAVNTDNASPKYVTLDVNTGLPSNEVYSVAEDKNGEVWVGTNKGVAVFYNPLNVFDAGKDWHAQQILVDQGGYLQKLLETEVVTCIAIDPANRKWFGTRKSGVFLMSADGTKQIHHFTMDNTPLLSNNILCISVDNETGEVFFGTEKGLISYKSDATIGEEVFGDVYAYPNPVRPGYAGPIAIKGLVNDAQVKITDVQGGLVYSTKALGGQATWDGKNMGGEKVQTGVYLVFCTNDDGSQTYVTKILFVN